MRLREFRIVVFLCVFLLCINVASATLKSEPIPGLIQTKIDLHTKAAIRAAQKFIPKMMRRYAIPGVAVAVVNSKGIIWARGFGYTDASKRYHVTPGTLFSVQSQSKMFTALGVLLAVQQGLLTLTTPIVQYIPSLVIHEPEHDKTRDKITLTNLLSHTAGFMFDAPVGNNNNSSTTFNKSIQSILPGTWLKFPPGKSYSYSNIGIDLAGYILQSVGNRPFAKYIHHTVLIPLGMHNSTFSIKQVLQDKQRALGTVPGMATAPLNRAMLPAGGLYSSANDMAHFIMFMLNAGKVKGKQLLPSALLHKMLSIPFPAQDQTQGTCLGVWKGMRKHIPFYGHLGRGFGFASTSIWYPQYHIGIVVLTNKYIFKPLVDVQIVHKILDPILAADKAQQASQLEAKMQGHYISNMGNITLGRQKAGEFGFWGSAINVGIEGSALESGFFPLDYYANNIFYCPRDKQRYRFVEQGATGVAELQRVGDAFTWYFNDGESLPAGPNKKSWRHYIGSYVIQGYGGARKMKVRIKDGYLYINAILLREYKKGIFRAANGDVLQLTPKVKRWRNLPLSVKES